MEPNKPNETPNTPKPKHTPTPWRTPLGFGNEKGFIIRSETTTIAGVWERGMSDAPQHATATSNEAQANARYIVTACNHHEALVRQLSQFTERFKFQRFPKRELEIYLENARALLAKLEAEAAQ